MGWSGAFAGNSTPFGEAYVERIGYIHVRFLDTGDCPCIADTEYTLEERDRSNMRLHALIAAIGLSASLATAGSLRADQLPVSEAEKLRSKRREITSALSSAGSTPGLMMY